MIPFNKPFMTGKDLWHTSQARVNGHFAGDGAFTKQCVTWIEEAVRWRMTAALPRSIVL